MALSLFTSTRTIPHPHRIKQDASKDRLGDVYSPVGRVRGTIRPTGRGFIGYAPDPKIIPSEKNYDERSLESIAVEYLVEGEVVRCPQKSGIELDPLPCQKNQSVAAPRIAAGLTSRGRKNIEDGGLILMERYGRNRLGFYTLTLSLDNEEDIQSFNDVAATALKRYLEKVKRYYERNGCKFYYLGVWELHPGRTARCGYPVLHFHYIAPCYFPGKKEFILKPDKIRDMWTSSVRATSGVQFARDCRIGAEIVKRNASGYLAKYMSKGVQPGCDDVSPVPVVRLSSWYSLSRNLLKFIKSCRFPVASFLVEGHPDGSLRGFLSDYCSSFGSVEVEFGDKKVVLGYWFVVNKCFHGFLLEIVRGIISSM